MSSPHLSPGRVLLLLPLSTALARVCSNSHIQLITLAQSQPSKNQ